MKFNSKSAVQNNGDLGDKIKERGENKNAEE